jgi:hypothetical protein
MQIQCPLRFVFCPHLEKPNHSSDILSIRFKHTHIIRFFGLFKKYLKILDHRCLWVWAQLKLSLLSILFIVFTFSNFKILENTSFWAPSKNTRISYVTTMNQTTRAGCKRRIAWRRYLCSCKEEEKRK